jgi:hypothetical protein
MRYWSLPPAVITAVGFGIFKAWHLGEMSNSWWYLELFAEEFRGNIVWV